MELSKVPEPVKLQDFGAHADPGADTPMTSARKAWSLMTETMKGMSSLPMEARKSTGPDDLISFVFPIYNESGNIRLLHESMDRVTADLVERIEFIYVIDGSQDDSLDLLQQLAEWDARITVIDLSRNHGHQLAVTAGLDFARGDAVVIMDSDLQDPPRLRSS